jgi:hypothetical protein
LLKWLLVIGVAIVVFTAATPWLSRYGQGRLPGDVAFRWKGRRIYLPFTTTLLLSAALMLLGRLV